MVRASIVGLFLVASAGCCCRPCGTPCTAAPVTAQVQAEGRAPQPDQIFLDATILQVPAASLADYAPTNDARVIPSAEAAVVLARATKDSRVRYVAAPKILALSDHEATSFVGETLADGTWTGWQFRTVATIESDTAVTLRTSFADRAIGAASERSATASWASMKSGETLRFVVPARAEGDDPLVLLVRPQVLRGAGSDTTRP